MENLKTTLAVLNLRKNRLHGTLPTTIFDNLRSLDVSNNQLVGTLPRSLLRLSNLEVLNVGNNGINDTFPSWLGSLKELQVLVLRANAFHGPIPKTRFSKLRIIDISNNHFIGALPSDCFVEWSAMSSLEIYEDGLSSKLQYMQDERGYYHDSIVLVNKGVALEFVRILKIYTAFDFSVNNLEGEIPSSIGLLKELHMLNFSSNAFTGYIPSSIANLKKLESLDVSRNKLSGVIPQALGDLSYLPYMNFSHNQLVGPVPGGTQFRRQPCSSFEDNPGLYGSSLDEVCVDIHGKTSQPSEMMEPEEGGDAYLNWIAAAIGFGPGVTFGITVGYILFTYKPEGFMHTFGRNRRRAKAHQLVRENLPEES